MKPKFKLIILDKTYNEHKFLCWEFNTLKAAETARDHLPHKGYISYLVLEDFEDETKI